MKMTKKLAAIFKKYKVALRDHDSEVYHPVYRTTTQIDPLQFAAYETAIKAQYVAWKSHPATQNHTDGFKRIAFKDGFVLPSGDFTQADGIQASKDLGYCTHLIGKDGLYYALLD
jgi:hypothetical protein